MIFLQKRNVYYVVLIIFGLFLLNFEILRRRSNGTINLSDAQIDLIIVDTPDNIHDDHTATKSTGEVVDKSNKDIDSQTASRLHTKKPQVCNIPVLNPFHPDITKFGEYSPKKPHCTYQWFTDITDDGILMVRDEVKDRVKTGLFAYIQRVTKDSQSVTEMNLFYDSDKKGIKV